MSKSSVEYVTGTFDCTNPLTGCFQIVQKFHQRLPELASALFPFSKLAVHLANYYIGEAARFALTAHQQL